MNGHATAGFTLVELLVSLALTAMGAALLITVLSTGSNFRRHASREIAASETIVAAQDLLRMRMEAMVPQVRFDGSAPYADVRGDSFQIDFTAPGSDATAPAPLQRYRLRLRQGALMLYAVDPQRRSIAVDGPDTRGWTASLLISGIQAVNIAYFGSAPPDGQRRWRNFWQGRPSVPELLRIRLLFDGGDRRIWPDLIIRPLATVNSACRLDPVTGHCREVRQ